MDTKGVGTVLVLVVLGLLLGGFGVLPTYEHNVAVQEGEPTTATVQSTDIDVDVDDDGDESYEPIVVYQYTVDGVEYESDNTFPGRFTRTRESRSWAEGIVGQYEPGDEVTIHYDPGNPGNAYLRNDGLPSTWFLGAAYVLLAALAGVWLIRQGFRRWRQRQLIANTPTETVRSLSVGRSELTGTAVTEDRQPMSAPFSEDDCVVASYEIEEYDDDSDDDGGSWRTIEEDTLHVPFYVDDGTGSVLVEPHDEAIFDLDPGDWTETYVDSSDRGPEPIREFVRETDGLEFPPNASGTDNDRKYRQNLVRDGESVYVFGDVRPSDGAERGASQADRLVVQYDDVAADHSMFLLSDDTEANLIDRREWALWRGPVGGAFLTVALVFGIGMFGPEIGLTLPVLF